MCCWSDFELVDDFGVFDVDVIDVVCDEVWLFVCDVDEMYDVLFIFVCVVDSEVYVYVGWFE